jgi:hypothetical protein
MEEAAALPIAHSAYASFDAWVAAIRAVADETFLDLGWTDAGDSMLDAIADFDSDG